MDRPTLNRIAIATALVAILASLASAIPLVPSPVQGLLAVVGFGALIAAIHTVRPAREEAREQEDATAHLLGVACAGLVAVLALLLVAATVARFGGVRYVGHTPLFLTQNFTLVTGPFLALVATAVLMAARGRLHASVTVTSGRRASTLLSLCLLALVSALFAGGIVGEAWQAPYLLGLGGVVAWFDATQMAGLPTLSKAGRWLERGETRESRWLVRALAHVGNGLVVVLGVAGVVLFALGFTGPGLIVQGVAAVLLTLTTHAAAGLSNAIPAEFGEEIARVEQEQSQLRLLALGPLAVAVVATLLTTVGVAALFNPGPLTVVLEVALPATGALVAVLAGVNLARSRLPAFEREGALRRAVSTVMASVLAASLFFSILVELGVMAGPVTEMGLGLLFHYTAVLGVSVFVLAQGMYPVPGADRDEKPGDGEEVADDDAASMKRSLVAVYAASGVFLVGAVGLLAMVMMGQLDLALPDSGEGRNAAFLATIGVGVMLLLGLAVVFFRSRQLDTPHMEGEVDFERDYTSEEVLRLTVLGISGTAAFVLAVMGTLVYMEQLEAVAGFALEKRYATDFWVFAVLIGIGPAGYLHNRERKRRQAIDERLPEFLRDLAESQRTGMTLTQAVITASKGNYGALTPEIKKMAAQIEWGVSFDRALSSFAERVETPLVQRTASLVIEASNSGGDVIDVLEAASEDAREIKQIEHERRSGMQIYVMIIYIAFLVFLGVIGVLNVKFMPEVADAVSGASGVSVGSIEFEEFDMQTFRTLFFHAAVVQGLGGGFVAGSMEEGSPSAGLKHAFAMTMLAYVAFRFLLGG